MILSHSRDDDPRSVSVITPVGEGKECAGLPERWRGLQPIRCGAPQATHSRAGDHEAGPRAATARLQFDCLCVARKKAVSGKYVSLRVVFVVSRTIKHILFIYCFNVFSIL